MAVSDASLPANQATPKIPQSFDGRSSWLAYEEAVDDWIDICTLDPEKQGPSLNDRLGGDAAVYKPLLDRDLLRVAATGVRYFKDTLRPHFSKVSRVYSYGVSVSFYDAIEDSKTC